MTLLGLASQLSRQALGSSHDPGVFGVAGRTEPASMARPARTQPTIRQWRLRSLGRWRLPRDGERWHFFGKAWTRPGEPLLVHDLPRFVRYRRLDGDRPWSAPLERSGSAPLTLLRLDEQAREELWPGRQHAGLPVLLPPGEEGRLLRFDRSSDGESFSWSLEFRGRLRGSAESRLGRTTR